VSAGAGKPEPYACDGWDDKTLLRGLSCSMADDDVRAALRRHWEASDANDFATEHQIYRADAVLDYPQSGERIRTRANIQASRKAQRNAKRFTVRRMLGGGDLWISELVMTYDGNRPTWSASWNSTVGK
jgi:SnoaL-like domain